MSEQRDDELEESSRLNALTVHDDEAQMYEDVLKVKRQPSMQLHTWVKAKPGRTGVK